jgi:hypothetical protein
MAFDQVIETFQATLIIAVMGVVALYIANRELGSIAIDFLPGFIQIVIYFFLILAVVAAVIEEIE